MLNLKNRKMKLFDQDGKLIGNIDKEDLVKKLKKASPPILENPNLADLKETIANYLAFIISNEYHEDNDYKQYIYEEAMKGFCGEKFFDWFNDVTD